tara:strand:+ start:775 stop:993 length:219 start_codon:yes stop_codon:yes gene_type:complete
MNFKQNKDGSGEIIFSKEEINIIKKNKKLMLTPVSLRHFGNVLVRMVTDWNLNFSKEVANLQTDKDSKVEGK